MTREDLEQIRSYARSRQARPAKGARPARRSRPAAVGRRRLEELLAEVGDDPPPWLLGLLDEAAVSTVDVDPVWLARTAERALARREDAREE